MLGPMNVLGRRGTVESKSAGDRSERGVALGIAFGAVLGISFALLTGWNLALGIAMGVALGIVFGAAYDANTSAKDR
jgi:hypothetical protein